MIDCRGNLREKTSRRSDRLWALWDYLVWITDLGPLYLKNFKAKNKHRIRTRTGQTRRIEKSTDRTNCAKVYVIAIWTTSSVNCTETLHYFTVTITIKASTYFQLFQVQFRQVGWIKKLLYGQPRKLTWMLSGSLPFKVTFGSKNWSDKMLPKVLRTA